jgi:hypothetical protein
MGLTVSQLAAGLSGYMSYKEQRKLPDVVLTVKNSAFESVGRDGEAEDKPVLAFVETRKKLVLNASRMEMLQELIGDEDPTGHRFLISTGPYEIKGKVHDQILIKEAPEE